jgi:hypothetical protein
LVSPARGELTQQIHAAWDARLALEGGEDISITPSARNCIKLIQIEEDLTEEYAKTTPDIHKIEKLMQELDRLSLTIAA